MEINIPQKTKGALSLSSFGQNGSSPNTSMNFNNEVLGGNNQYSHVSNNVNQYNNAPTTMPVNNQGVKGVSLKKGEKVTLLDLTNDLRNLKVCVQWDLHPSLKQDLDVSCFMCDKDGKVINDNFFVFYGSDRSPDGAIFYHGDSRDGSASGDDEIISANLEMVDPRVERMFFVLTIHEAKQLGLSFRLVNSSLVRVVDDNTGKELLRYVPSNVNPEATAISICEIYRYRGQWKFKPMGDGLVNRDLYDLCAFYGVKVED